jgi:hypothetical protein
MRAVVSSTILRLLALPVIWLAAGCTGSATIQFVSLHHEEIDPPTTKVWRFDASECYWWLDDAGELNVAMKCRQHNLLLGHWGDVELDLSFVLGEPPAGSGRNYPIRRRHTRSRFVSALQSQRLTSQAGIVGVIVEDGGAIRGSFRIWMMPQKQLRLFDFFPQQSGQLLCFGTFHAVEDAARGRAIRAHCEAEGWTRPARKPIPVQKPPPVPTSRPQEALGPPED